MSRQAHLRRVFDLALAMPPDQRAAVLDRECRGDAALRAENGPGQPRALTADSSWTAACKSSWHSAPAQNRRSPRLGCSVHEPQLQRRSDWFE